MNRILSLAMLKMEKNFVAHDDKGYPRNPYNEYPLFSEDHLNLTAFVGREKLELDSALDILDKCLRNYARVQILSPSDIQDQVYKVMLEVADVSNTLDYLFERLLEEYHDLEEKAN